MRVTLNINTSTKIKYICHIELIQFFVKKMKVMFGFSVSLLLYHRIWELIFIVDCSPFHKHTKSLVMEEWFTQISNFLIKKKKICLAFWL